VFGWLAFLGTFLFYRAFVLAVPSGRPRAYLAYLFFLPSLLFWPSATGKDAWMVFAIGIAAFGAAKMMSGETTRGLIVLAVGLWLGGLVRPHISGIVVAALAGAYLLKRARPEARQLGPILRVASVVAVVVVAVVFVRRGQEYLSGHGINTGEGLVGALQQAGAQTTRGTSQFSPHIITGPTQLLPGTVTVLYRPFPTEADNRLALVAALEGVFLAVVTAWRWRWIVSAIRSGRRQPYIMFAFLTAGLLIVALSSIGNFGLLVRERSQMLPFFLVLLSVPPPAPNSEVAVPARPNRAVVAMMQRSEISS